MDFFRSAAAAGLAIMLALQPGSGIAGVGATVKRSAVGSALHVVAVASTPDSKPFGSLGTQPARYGYVEEEFFVSGAARAYAWAGPGFAIRAISEPGPYTIRILVLRPQDPKRFSGNAEVELLNSSRGYDDSVTLTTSADLIMERGDVFIGVTSKALAVNALKRFDPERYAGLAWSNPVPEEDRCASPSIFPSFMKGRAPDNLLGSNSASEDGLIYEIYAQIGAFLKGARRGEILPGFARPRLFSTGTSQSGMLQRTYLNAIHPSMRLADGGPIYDGYLIEVAPGVERINQCSDDIYPKDPRNLLRRVDVPVIDILSEGDMKLGQYHRQPERIGLHSGLVGYEIAGGAHLPGISRVAFAGDPPAPATQGEGDFVFPRGYVSRAALTHLQRWAGAGVRPPAGRRLPVSRGVFAHAPSRRFVAGCAAEINDGCGANAA